MKHQTNIAIVVPHHKPPLGAPVAAGIMAAPAARVPPQALPFCQAVARPGVPAQFRRGAHVLGGAQSGISKLQAFEDEKRRER